MTDAPPVTLPWAMSPVELDTWVAGAAPGERVAYARGPAIPRGAGWTHAMALRDDGVITLTSRLVDARSRRWEWLAERVRAPLSPRVAPRPPGTDPGERLLAHLHWLAQHRQPCPSNKDLAEACALHDADAARYRLRALADRGDIDVQHSDSVKGWRIVTIAATGRRTAEPTA